MAIVAAGVSGVCRITFVDDGRMVEKFEKKMLISSFSSRVCLNIVSVVISMHCVGYSVMLLTVLAVGSTSNTPPSAKKSPTLLAMDLGKSILCLIAQ